jgi:hypothetical protein
MYKANVVIHIDEALDDDHIHSLERELSARDGVVSACVHDHRRHLMIVDYDPNVIGSADLLSQVKAGGVHAELIGL